MANILHLIQMVSALILIVLVLVQRTQGDMGSSFGDNMSIFQTRRGAERFLFLLTATIAIIFVISSVAVFAL